MQLQRRGRNTSRIEVQNISAQGIWLLVNDKEYFLPYKNYPWFKNARTAEILKVRLLHQDHLSWPDLDVDLELASLGNLEKYPLVYK